MDLEVKKTDEISDGYHTMSELYEHRHALTLALMKALPKKSWFSKRHYDGALPFGDDSWFIVGIDLPGSGTVTYHLPKELWPLAVRTGAEERHRGKQWDGHTPGDVVDRLNKYAAGKRGG